MFRLTPQILKKIDPYIVLLLLIGVAVFIIKCQIIYPIQYVGHADSSAYAEMADSLIHGRGFEVDYLSFYFIKYPNIVRPEDHWPPLYSILIAPFYIIFGKTAFSAKLPSVIISCFFLPLVTFSLAKQLSKSRIAGVASGMTVLLSPSFFSWSLHPLSDVTYTFIVCAFALFSMKALDDEKNFYYAGIFMGLAYYAKGTGILLFPCYIVFHLIARYRLKRYRDDEISFLPFIKTLLFNKRFLIGLIIGFLILFPWLVRNFVHFRDPLFSTQRFAAGYGGYVDWEIGTYDLYWGEKPPLTYKDKFKDGIGYVAKMTLDYLKTNIWWTFIDIKSNWGKFGNEAFLTYITNIPAIIGLFLLWGNKKRHIIWLISVSLLIFLSATWFPIDRMVIPLLPLMVAFGWATYYIMLKFIFKYLNRLSLSLFSKFYAFILPFITQYVSNIKHYVSQTTQYAKIAFKPEITAGFIMLCVLSPIMINSGESIQNSIKHGGYPYRETDQAWMDMGRWLKENVPSDSVTMTRNPWELHFYSEQPAVQIPRTTLDKTIEVMRFYHVSYIIPQLDIRPSLEPMVKGELPGFELVYDNKTLQLYKIRYDLINKWYKQNNGQ